MEMNKTKQIISHYPLSGSRSGSSLFQVEHNKRNNATFDLYITDYKICISQRCISQAPVRYRNDSFIKKANNFFLTIFYG